MKKLLLFFAALCCTLGVSAERHDEYYDELPSGTGPYERTIVNIDYDVKTKTLSFDDTYLPTYTAYERNYCVYFHEWKPEYKYGVSRWDDNTSFVFYEGSLIKYPGEDSSNNYSHFYATKSIFNSNGGHVAIDLSSAIEKLKSQTSSTNLLVSISAAYRVVSGAQYENYSMYPDTDGTNGTFLLNSKHINIEGNHITVSPEIARAVTAQGLTMSPEDKKSIELRANGTDGAMLQADVQVKSDVEKDVTYIWEYRDDNNSDWKQLSKGTVSKSNFNTKTSIQKIPTCEVNFTASNKPINVRYVRVRLDTEDGAVVFDYKTEVALYLAEEKYDLFIGGKQITSKNCNDFYGNGVKDIVYDPASSTLTLNNARSTNMGDDYIVSYSSGQPLNICVIGDCQIMNQGTGYAIRSDYKDVRIYGEGKLEIVRGQGIGCESNLSLTDGVTVDIDSYMQNASGISLYGEGVLKVDNATLTAKGKPSIWNVKDIVMKNGVNILSAGHKFDAAKKAVVDASGNATSELVKIGVGTPDAIQNVVTEKASQNGKFVRNNQLIIKRGDEYYNAQGVVVK